VFVVVGENEPFEKAFKKFKRLVEKEGILTEVRSVNSTKNQVRRKRERERQQERE
jgi:ribosomal protein S21